MVLALAVGLAMVALAGSGLLAHKMGLLPGGKPAQPSVIPDPPPADLQRVQELAFWEIDLEQKEGSRLIYVLARVLNESPVRRYGVRVEFELRNEAGEPVASATDYIATLDPGEHTRVKALVVSSQAHSAIVRGITEQ